MDYDDGLARVDDLVSMYVDALDAEFQAHIDAWQMDVSDQAAHEVVGGLLARQVTLAREFALNPAIWTHGSAPVLLRAMADVYISFAWVLEDRAARSRKYIEYGLGQAKLELEHRRAEAEGKELSEEEAAPMDAMEAWIERQRLLAFVEVDLSNGPGPSTRKMAEEAECLDFHRHVYAPFSAAVHSTWRHVALHNLVECENELHHPHRLPVIGRQDLDPWYLHLAAKYCAKTFRRYRYKLGVQTAVSSAYSQLQRAISDLARTKLEEAGPEEAAP